MKRSILIFGFFVIIALIFLVRNIIKPVNDDNKLIYTVCDLRGKWTILTPEKRPFFFLAVNHAHVLDKLEKLISEKWGTTKEASIFFANVMKEAGYNAAGYRPYHAMLDYLPFAHGNGLIRTSFHNKPRSFSYVDVWDPQFEKKVSNIIRIVTDKTSGHRNLIGYYWTDTPRWDLKIARETRNTDFVSHIRNLGPESNGKHEYLDYVKIKYDKNIEEFNLLYEKSIIEWDELLTQTFDNKIWDNEKVYLDDLGFLRLIARKLYSDIAANYKKYDKNNHLILGDKYKLHDHPDCVLEEASKFVDIISIQPGCGASGFPLTLKNTVHHEKEFEGDLLDYIHKLTGKPIIICDHHVSFPIDGFVKTSWYQYPTMEKALKEYEKFVMQCLEKPYIVGYGRCQFIDRVKPGNRLKQGIINTSGTPHVEYIRELKKVNARIMKKRNETVF